MNRQLTGAELRKVGVILGLVLALGAGTALVLNKARAGQEEADFIRQMNREMGRRDEANLTSKPEEEGQRSDPHFQP